MARVQSTALFRFLLWDWLGLDTVIDRPRYAGHDKLGIEGVIEAARRLSDDVLASSARAMDSEPPHLAPGGSVSLHPASANAVKALAENGFFATVFDEEFGGLQLPQLVHAAVLGLSMAGDVATASYMILTIGNARLIAEKGTRAQIETFAVPQIAGTAMGTMCLSEPHAGSALGTITTRAVPDGEDELGQRFRVRGSKMWISGGDQDATENIVHLVLAKVPNDDGELPGGTRGISLFIVPKILPDGEANDLSVVGLNHKLGQRALPNCALAFGEGRHQPRGTSGAVGWLLGDVGQGLAQMFQLMNDARVSVGMGGAMLAVRGYWLSLAYARERMQGNVAGREVAIIEHADVRRMLLRQKAISEGALALVLFGARLLDDEQTESQDHDRQAAGSLIALLTPAIKSWPAEFGQEALHEAIQVLGGAGYTTDHEVEKLYRDNRLNPIHEGTTGIQAIDLVGRKLRRDRGLAFQDLARRVLATVGDAGSKPELAASADAIDCAWRRLSLAADQIVSTDDEAWVLEIATPFLNAFGHVVVAWLWLDQTLVATQLPSSERDGDPAFHAGRLRALRYFVDCELPRIAQWLHPIENHSDAVAPMVVEEF